MMNKKIIVISVLIVFIIVAFVIFNGNYYKIEDRTTQLKEFRYFNSKATGWLKIQGTDIDMPIMLLYDVEDVSDPKYDIGWTDDKGKQPLVIIKSHNMRNVSSHPLINDKNHARFEQLMGFVYYDFAKNNQYIQYTVDGKNYLYRIYSVFFTNSDYVNKIGDNYTKDDRNEYINKSKKNSLYLYENSKTLSDDDLLVLVTCTRFYGLSDNDQFVVNARRVHKDERIKKYGVREKKNYQKVKKVLDKE